MSQPPAYTPTTDFSDEERDNVGGRSTVRTAALDAELSSIAESVNALIVNIGLNQRDDGEIRDGRVKLFTLASDVLALLTSYGAAPRGAWLTATQYNLKDLVSQSGNTYIAVSAHTSGVFATDLAAGKWLLFSLSTAPGATQVTFTPTTNVSATNVQAAIEESDTENRALSAAAMAALAAFAAQLLNVVSASSGPALVAYNELLAYPDDTVGGEFRKARKVSQYGAVAGDGVTNDAVAWQAAAASGPGVIDARGFNSRIDSTIDIGTGQIWLLEGATLRNPLSNFTFLRAQVKSGFALLGPFACVGGGSTVGTAKAIHIEDCSDWYVDRPVLSNIQGWGIYLSPGSSTSSRSRHGTVNNPRIDSCYVGYEDTPGTGSEYCQVIGAHVTRCASAGIKTASGNMKFTGGLVVDNPGNGVIVSAGANHAHGGFNGLSINHNGAYGIRCDKVVNGELFNDCHIYENPIYIDGCVGVVFDGGVLDANVVCDKDVNSRLVVFRGMFCPGDYSSVTISGSGTDMILFRECHGLGAVNASRTINDPAPVYVQCRRLAAVTQSMTSGVAATLIWPTEIFDRRVAHDPATGITTIPAEQWGAYTVTVSAVFSGTAMNAAASTLVIQINGVDKRIAAAVAIGTTRLMFQITEDFYLAAGDTITIRGNVTGTTPVFGDATYESSLTVEKRA